MADTKELLSLLKENTTHIEDFLDDLSDDVDPSEKPARQSWSLLDCLEHIARTDENILWIFKEESREEDRSPEKKVEEIEDKFLDFKKRFRAFGPIAPKGKYESVEEGIKDLKEIREKLIDYGDENGWNYLCLGFSHPLFGELTRAEWIHFAAIHGKRHFKQMKWIKERLTGEEEE